MGSPPRSFGSTRDSQRSLPIAASSSQVRYSLSGEVDPYAGLITPRQPAGDLFDGLLTPDRPYMEDWEHLKTQVLWLNPG